ncbi:hypothetical protein VNO77_12359 [Canavalia gladiata]|uniref:Cysteine-rich receptor-like protein kinase 29 n=1 Tax=Canavalia gladiata TaxID=3824 RepID=A0AAN9QPP7_CANGL
MLFFLFLIVILISHATAEPDYNYTVCTGRDFDPNSTYHTNLNTLLPRLISDTQVDYGFYNSSFGQDSDRVYATGLCRGDVTPPVCRTCLNDSIFLLRKECANKIEAVGGYDKCMLHYSTDSLSGYQESNVRIYLWSNTNVTDWNHYSYVLKNLLSKLRVKAATSDSHLNRNFAAGNATAPSSQPIYALVQCSPDLTGPECNDCLIGAFSELSKYCNNRSGGGVIKVSCNFRYENYSFYDPKSNVLSLTLSPQGSPPPAPTPSTTTNTNFSDSTYHGSSKRSRAVIAIVVPTVASVGLLIFICMIYLRVRKPTRHFESEAKVEEEIIQVESSQFDFDTIKIATNNFSDANKLGQGGFGPVYKGTLLNEQEVAVKRLSSNSGQGDIEFKNELILMAKLRHRNLVRLLGFCIERKERLLVYEFLPNKSLDNFLFDPIKRTHLDWKTRYNTIEGIARGLLYLHEDSQQRIIHRDLKSSNILLDADMNPKISDFGLARLFVVDQTQANASKIVGTLGYMAPEYARHGKFSVKSDVFSFGVIILEIVSGQKNGGFRNGEDVEHLLSFAWKNWKKGTSFNVMDPTLNDALRDEVVRCIHIGLLCVQDKVADRPTLASVVLMLDSDSFALPVPLQPAYFMSNGWLPDNQFSGSCSVEIGSKEKKSDSAEASVNEASISSLYPR